MQIACADTRFAAGREAARIAAQINLQLAAEEYRQQVHARFMSLYRRSLVECGADCPRIPLRRAGRFTPFAALTTADIDRLFPE